MTKAARDRRNARPQRFRVISPDGLPIEPRTFATVEAAQAALAQWLARFESQGFYGGVSRRIALADLPHHCVIAPVVALTRPAPKKRPAAKRPSTPSQRAR